MLAEGMFPFFVRALDSLTTVGGSSEKIKKNSAVANNKMSYLMAG